MGKWLFGLTVQSLKAKNSKKAFKEKQKRKTK